MNRHEYNINVHTYNTHTHINTNTLEMQSLIPAARHIIHHNTDVTWPKAIHAYLSVGFQA
jgi:hypothetical protein